MQESQFAELMMQEFKIGRQPMAPWKQQPESVDPTLTISP
jgi:hypothetical protein